MNEQARACGWLDSLGVAEPPPNLLNNKAPNQLERAWSERFGDEDFVYYERELGDQTTEYWIGNLAVAATTKLSRKETREALLGSINTRQISNEQARNSLAVLIGVKYDARNRIMRRRTPEDAEASHFYQELEKLSGISVEDSSALGLANFRNSPIGRYDHGRVYIYAREELELNKDTGVPILNYDKTARVWRLKFVEPNWFSGFFNKPQEDVFNCFEMLRNWLPVNVDDIKQLTAMMAEDRSDSL